MVKNNKVPLQNPDTKLSHINPRGTPVVGQYTGGPAQLSETKVQSIGGARVSRVQPAFPNYSTYINPAGDLPRGGKTLGVRILMRNLTRPRNKLAISTLGGLSWGSQAREVQLTWVALLGQLLYNSGGLVGKNFTL